ncbi:MAG: hypothetical protein FXF47_00745 [Candidatus Mcinerneyibacterium aminivorans]|uniref:Uncharacterized protein n=1 Tax=Candidatus Mcinerneyibacterium aminivorans TaxID=2703815 RepID=A0A5D0MKL3_9BACT|nr:MAG: hypothetical protein FXF47_00745 [Candidatus Mcinerneyibacterium aminivorans]
MLASVLLMCYNIPLLDNLDSTKKIVFCKKQLSDVTENEEVHLWLYSSKPDKLELLIDNKKVLQTKGKEIKYKIKPKKDVQIKYLLSDRSISYKINVNKIPKIRKIKTKIFPPPYFSNFFLQKANQPILENSLWTLTANTTKPVQNIIIEDNSNNTTHSINSRNIRIKKRLKNGDFSVYFTYNNNRYLISKYNYSMTQDSPPLIKLINPSHHVYTNNLKNLKIKYLIRDDYKLKKSNIYLNNKKIKTFFLNKKSKILSHEIKLPENIEKTSLKIDVYDIKNQVAKIDPIKLEKLDDDKIKDYINKSYKKNIDTNQKNFNKLKQIQDEIEELNKNIKLKGEPDSKQKENIQNIKNHLEKIKNDINRNKQLLKEEEQQFIENYANKEINKMIKELNNLLKEVDINKLRKKSNSLSKKSQTFQKSLQNFINALKKLKTLQNLKDLINKIEKENNITDISEKLKKFENKINHYTEQYKKAEENFNRTGNKKELLNKLNKVKNLLSGKNLEKLKNKLLDILRDQIMLSYSIKNSLIEEEITIDLLRKTEKILNKNRKEILNFEEGIMYLDPNLLNKFNFVLFEINKYLGKYQKINRYLSFKNIKNSIDSVDRLIIKSLKNIEKKSSQINLSNLLNKIQKVKKKQKRIFSKIKQLSSKAKSRQFKNQLDKIMENQKSLKNDIEQMMKNNNFNKYKKMLKNLKESMENIIKEENPQQKMKKLKNLNLKLEKIANDISSKDYSKKRKRQLIDKILQMNNKPVKKNELYDIIMKYKKNIDTTSFEKEINEYYNKIIR